MTGTGTVLEDGLRRAELFVRILVWVAFGTGEVYWAWRQEWAMLLLALGAEAAIGIRWVLSDLAEGHWRLP